jgi:hypothetical protein
MTQISDDINGAEIRSIIEIPDEEERQAIFRDENAGPGPACKMCLRVTALFIDGCIRLLQPQIL